MLKKLKPILAIAMMLILCFSSLTALAADPPDDDDDDDIPAGPAEIISTQAAINKTLQLPIGTNTPDATFKFTAEKISIDGVTTDEVRDTMPDIDESRLTLSFTQADTGTENPPSDVVSVVKETGDIFAGINFPHAGIYVYEITEQGKTNPTIDDNDPDEVLTYSQAKYMVAVYVANNPLGTGTYIAGIGTRVVTNDAGEDASGNKVDATPGGNGAEYLFSQMAFTNTYVKTNGPTDPENPDPTSSSTLSVTKKVTGDYASKEQYFDFKMSLSPPSLVTDVPEFYRAYIVENDAVIDPKDNANASVIGEDAGGNKYIEISTTGETAFKLKDSQSLVFVDTPVGSNYVVTEAATPNYIPSYIVTTDSSAGTEVTGIMNTELSTKTQRVGERVNSADFTNNRESVTPTGLNLNDLPFIGLIALAIASLLIFLVAKSRKKDTRDRA